jgi:RNA polymerase sigma-70 factor (ECF subfamily)
MARLGEHEAGGESGGADLDGAHDPDFMRRLEQVVASLPRLQRAIFFAHRVEAMSYDEIARRTGLSARQVEQQIARALYHIDRQISGKPHLRWRRWF